MLSAITHLFSRNTGMLLVVSASLFLLGGTCNMYYQNYADTRREFIRLSWLLGDWRAAGADTTRRLHWENDAADRYSGQLPCIPRLKHPPVSPVSPSACCEYQIVRVDGALCLDNATTEPALGLRYVLKRPTSHDYFRFDDRIDTLATVFSLIHPSADTIVLIRRMSLAGDSMIDTFVRGR